MILIMWWLCYVDDNDNGDNDDNALGEHHPHHGEAHGTHPPAGWYYRLQKGTYSEKKYYILLLQFV